MKIDIDKLSESELIDLNNRIVERLRFLKQGRAHVQMLKFKIGDRVTFHPEGLPPLIGMLTRYNRNGTTLVPAISSLSETTFRFTWQEGDAYGVEITDYH